MNAIVEALLNRLKHSIFLYLIFCGPLLFPPSARAATLVYTNDVMGEIEPCGCRSNPQGGMLRKSNLLKKLPDQEILQLDAGDLLFPTDVIPIALAGQSELQATYLLKSMDLTHHDAVVPGEKDFAMGLKIFENLRKKTKIQFLAANLKKRDGQNFLSAFAVFKRKNQGQIIRISVIGLVGKNLKWPKELKASDPISTAKHEVPGLRKKSDLVIALTHQGYDADVALAKAVKGIDMIIGGHSQSFLQNPVKVGSTWIYQSSFRNQYIGVVPLIHPFNNENHQLIGLDAGYESPNEQTNLVHEFKSALAKLNTEEASHSVILTASESLTAKYHTFPRCAECHFKQFDFWRKTRHANAFAALVKDQQTKNKECLSCHSVGLGEVDGFSNIDRMAVFNTGGPPPPEEDLLYYLKQVHEARSLDEKVKITRTSTESTPLKRSLSSFERIWVNVQCENCHQPGQGHPFSGTYSKSVPQHQCLKCHTAERAPEWYKAGKPDLEKIAQKRVLITCPAGELSEEKDD